MEETKVLKKKKMLVPKLRFKEFNSDLVAIQFGKVVDSNLYGPRFNANDYSANGNVKTIRGTDLGKDGEIKYDQVPLAMLDEKTISTHKLNDGDIVMITTAECGSTGIFRKQEIDYLSSAYGVRIRLNGLGYPYFFKFFFQTWLARKEINSFIRKATVANLPGSDILRIRLNLPSISEQQKIASFLSSVDEKIQQLTRKKELLEHYKKGMMQQLFSCKRRFKDEKGKAYPDWDQRRLSEITICLDNIRKPLNDSERQNMKGEIPYWGANNIMDYIDDYLFDETLVLLAEDGGNFYEYKTRPIANLSYGKCWVNNHTHVIKGKENLNNEFLFYSLVHKNITGHVSGGTRAKLTKGEMMKISIGFPCLPEQIKIAFFLMSIDNKIERVNHRIEQSQTFKKGLLQQLFV